MKPKIKNILAVIAGWLGGSGINFALIYVGHRIFPIQGIDPNDMEALAQVMPTLEFEYFIFPFLAHAIGTLAGATIAGLIAATHKMKISLIIGLIFFIGGIAAAFMIPAPVWFLITDLFLAYFPMAWLGGMAAKNYQRNI